MKKLIAFLIVIAVFVVACTDNQPASNNNASVPANPPPAPVDNSPYAAGKGVYQRTCIVCHQPDGTGMEGTYPPLAKSDYLLANKSRAIEQVLMGSSNEVTVNGKKYHSVMPAQSNLKDDEVADVLSYVYHSFDNNGFTVTEADVKAVKDSLANAERNLPYAAGKAIYTAKCVSCHTADGHATRICPPLEGSDYFVGNKKRAIIQLIKGTSDEITVAGTKYTGTMPAQELSDEDAAAVLNYISHSFGNKGYTVTAADVKSAR
jgi:mono/diheme cytochrome c family protein